jgi:hypothetical protein
MKGSTSSDGYMSGNQQTVGSYEKSKKPKAAPEPSMGGSEDPTQVAAEHGPAHEIHMQHDHEGGKHSVHSKHGDGHEHHSEHNSAHEAHQHAQQVAGVGNEQESEPMGAPPMKKPAAAPMGGGYMG